MAEPRADKNPARKIDALDVKLQSLINGAPRLALEVAETSSRKASNNFYRRNARPRCWRNVMARHQGPLSAEAMARLVREIMSACLALESRLRVAFLGPEGTFTQEARSSTSVACVETRRSRPSTRCSARSNPAAPSSSGAVRTPPRA